MVPQPNCDSALIWRKSSASGGNSNCVEVASSGSSVLVRDSADRLSGVLAFTGEQWHGLIRRIQNGQVVPK